MKRFVLLSCLALSLAAPVTAQEPESTAVLVGGRSTYEVKAGDTLSSIGARFGVTIATLRELNPRTGLGALAVGESLAIDNTHIALLEPRASVTINVAQRMLFLKDGDGVLAYPVTVGRRTWPTPVGAFTVISKETDPVWDVPVSIQREMERQGKPVITRMEPSPLNPLGAYWIGLSLPGLGIHGTNAPSSIFQFASHGCIRMHPNDVADLFPRVQAGMSGVLTYQPVIVAVIDGRVWIEAHPDAYKRTSGASRYVRDVTERAGVHGQVDWSAVDRALDRRQGRAVDVTTP